MNGNLKTAETIKDEEMSEIAELLANVTEGQSNQERVPMQQENTSRSIGRMISVQSPSYTQGPTSYSAQSSAQQQNQPFFPQQPDYTTVASTQSQLVIQNQPQYPNTLNQPAKSGETVGRSGDFGHKMEDDYLTYSILNLFCCCCVFGIISIILSCQAKTSNEKGDYSKAKKYGSVACTLNIAGGIIGTLTIIMSIIIRSGILFS